LERYIRGDSFWGINIPLDIIENLYLEKPSFRPSKWPQKLKPAKNSKLPKLPESHFEPFGKGGWPPISPWITYLHEKGDRLSLLKNLIKEGHRRLHHKQGATMPSHRPLP
jgi:hypothetical protein